MELLCIMRCAFFQNKQPDWNYILFFSDFISITNLKKPSVRTSACKMLILDPNITFDTFWKTYGQIS